MKQSMIRNVRLIDLVCQVDQVTDLLISPDKVELVKCNNNLLASSFSSSMDANGLIAIAGLLDLHVHFRQPGFEYKETIESGSKAALAGGVTSVVVMPNTNPTLDTKEIIEEQIALSKNVNGVRLMVAGAVTKGLKGEIPNDYRELKKAGAVAITDDGRPVMSDVLMKHALKACVENDLVFMQHAEDLHLSQSAPLNEGETSRRLCLKGQPADAEGIMVERDIQLAKMYGARYHVLHISTKRSLNAVRKAKMQGLKVTCEVAPHHLLLNDEACLSLDTNKKMNPPLRSESDRLALLESLIDGTIDAVASDHAPHSKEEKCNDFCSAPFGVVGLETAFSVLLTLVYQNVISLKRAIELMTAGPSSVLQKQDHIGTVLKDHASKDLCLIDLNKKWQVNKDALKGRSENSAFLGYELHGKVVATYLRGLLRHSELEGFKV